MKCFVGLGSNLGDRRSFLESAAAAIALISATHSVRVSPIYETPALVPPDAPPEWTKPYLNAAAAIEWNGTAVELLNELKKIEKRLGRADAARWAPRPIDLDILVFGDIMINNSNLNVPHVALMDRAFVLDPLKDLEPGLMLPHARQPVVVEARRLAGHSPWIMGILNVTPDSFSDGGELNSTAALEARLAVLDESGVHAIDLGAESTRPGATPVTAIEEWRRLAPALRLLKERYDGRHFRPFISVDTYRPEVALQALAYGVDCINDVSGVSNPKMMDIVRDSGCYYVLMHSLTVPADRSITLPETTDIMQALRLWLDEKLGTLERYGIARDKIIFDPGLGFGKTERQSIEILKRLKEFSDLPVRIFIGHSRKSFTKAFGATTFEQRDTATLALSLELAHKGADILRVHDVSRHTLAFRARAEVIA